MSAHRHRVVVIGAGFGGLAVVKGLRDQPVDVVLVDQNNFHTFQPLLYQVATAGLDVDDIAYAVRGIFRRQRNVQVRMACVTAVDTAGRLVHCDAGPPVPYDTLVIAAGAISTSYGVPGVDAHAFPLKSAADAVALRQHVIGRYESAVNDPTLVDSGALDVVVCGGGPTGVEVAGGLMELFTRVLAEDFPQLDVRRARVLLVEAGERLLPSFSEASSEHARSSLASTGVEVLTRTGVAEVTPTEVVLTDGRRLASHTLVWAAGVRAHPIAATLGVELGRGGRIVVDPDLSVPSRPEVFAIGDVAGDRERPLPQVAQPAIQGGRHVARQIAHRLAGRPTEPFEYVDKGSMATIGRHRAVVDFPNGRRLDGFVGWVAWLGLHLVYLMGFRNRANVLVNWAWNYVTYDRAARLLTGGAPSRR